MIIAELTHKKRKEKIIIWDIDKIESKEGIYYFHIKNTDIDIIRVKEYYDIVIKEE